MDKINESFVDDDKTFTLQSSVSDLFYLNPRDQLARHTVRRREKDNVAIFVPGGHKPLRRELKAVIGAKSKLADIRSGLCQSIGIFRKRRTNNQCLAWPQSGAQEIDELCRTVADQYFRGTHPMIRSQSFLEFFAISG